VVEIIKRGKLPGNQVHECTCRDCKTVFRFKEAEAEYVSDQRDGNALKISCPVCSRACWIAA
jgi:hypothetical protein